MEQWRHYDEEERIGWKDKLWDATIKITLVILGLGLMYIYFIVLTNVCHKLLFADSFCEGNVWGICGVKDLATNKELELKSFAVAFLLVQFTLTSSIIATILLIMNHMEKNPNLYLEGRNRLCAYPKYVLAIILYAVSGITLIFIISIWGGRNLAIKYISNCKFYENTHLGFYGCVNYQGIPVYNSQCNRCCGVGLAMLGVPLSVFFTLIFYLYKGFRRFYKDVSCSSSGVSCCNSCFSCCTKNKKAETVRIDLGRCDVCNAEGLSCSVLSCGHRICLFCAFTNSTCPHCT